MSAITKWNECNNKKNIGGKGSMARQLTCKTETCKTRRPKDMFRNINNVTEKEYGTAGGCLKAKDGSITIEKWK